VGGDTELTACGTKPGALVRPGLIPRSNQS